MLWSRSFKSMVLACALIAGGCDRQSEAPTQPEPEAAGKATGGKLERAHAGTPLPEVTVTDPDGEELALTSLKGRPVLINLWATWCAPCVTELPTLNAIANRADMVIEVVTISQDMAAPEKVRQFLDQRGLAQLPAWIDAKGDLPATYGLGTLPATILYDAQGKEVWRYEGGRDWADAQSDALLREAAASPNGG